ncbi:sulfate/molybdate ABC transporter ATP-binding protein [Salsipaludibacter albus]|uniref:sulfate/molybdate ABC transporter ATP-binding protein n=1 Tax=Salsipaludibacter albus TaxID=2849650 RepID=UPI001EE4B63C
MADVVTPPAPHERADRASGLDASLDLTRDDGFRLRARLAIPAGRTAALLGPNGAGKSTVVGLLAGLLALDDGHVGLAGRVLDDPTTDTFVPAASRHVGVVFQDHLLFGHLDVRDNVAFGPRSRGVPRREARERADHWLELLGLAAFAHHRPDQLSGGQAQRVALARALVTEPDLLLLDEPLSALDVTTRVSLRRTLATHLADFAGPRLLITHDPTEAFLLADEVHVLEHGRITQVGSPDEVRLRPRTPYVADLAGANLLVGEARDGIVRVTPPHGDRELHVADHDVTGPVLLTLRPTAVSVHREQPEGSQRNTWHTTVDRLERLGDRVRLRSGQPLPLTVEVTRESTGALGLAVGTPVWLAVKATEIGLQLDSPAPTIDDPAAGPTDVSG